MGGVGGERSAQGRRAGRVVRPGLLAKKGPRVHERMASRGAHAITRDKTGRARRKARRSDARRGGESVKGGRLGERADGGERAERGGWRRRCGPSHRKSAILAFRFPLQDWLEAAAGRVLLRSQRRGASSRRQHFLRPLLQRLALCVSEAIYAVGREVDHASRLIRARTGRGRPLRLSFGAPSAWRGE